MKYRKNVTDKTICIGSFIDTEITNQFQYTGKKGNVYMFHIVAINDSGIQVVNPVTNEHIYVAPSAIKKMKTIDGSGVEIEKYDSVDKMEIVNALISGDDFNCFDSNLNPITIASMITANKVTSFANPNNEVISIDDIVKLVSVDTFG